MISRADFSNLYNYLQAHLADLRGKLLPDADLGKLTWFRTGGKADLLFEPADIEDLQYFLQHLPAEVPLFFLGIGSNLLVRDGGIEGVVIKLPPRQFGDIKLLDNDQLLVGAGAPDKWVANFAYKAGLAGLHFLYGIPGNIGGALRMNAGANGAEIKDFVHSVVALDRSGKKHIFSCVDMGYSYRRANIDKEFIFVEAIFQLAKGEEEEIKTAMEAVKLHRETVQPVREKTGGSTFKNFSDISAWQLIDQAGCRGLQLGGAQISELHCNFMINNGNASSYELELLGETVRQRVWESQARLLEWEIARIGKFTDGQIIKPFNPH